MKTLWIRRNAAAAILGLLAFVAAARADEGPEPPPLPRTQGESDYARLVIAALPPYDTSILAVHNGPDWMAGKTVHDVAQAARDNDPTRIVSRGPVTIGYDDEDGPRMVKLDTDRGYIRYSNRDRSFHPGIPCGAIPQTSAVAVFRGVLSSLGLPAEEEGEMLVDTPMERAVDGETENPPERSCELERMLTLSRSLPNGLPVFDCWARGSVSNLGDFARLSVRWPQFRLAPGLALRSRSDVIDELARRIWEAEADDSGLGPEQELSIRLGYVRTPAGYVPAARVAFGDIYSVGAGQIELVALAQNPTSGVGPAADDPAGIAAVQLRALVDPRGRTAVLEFYLPSAEEVRMTVVDAAGREVAVVAQGPYGQGWHRLEWNLRDRESRPVPAGIYFARLQAGDAAPARKILVIR